jgi:hypothetical protein
LAVRAGCASCLWIKPKMLLHAPFIPPSLLSQSCGSEATCSEYKCWVNHVHPVLCCQSSSGSGHKCCFWLD